MKKFLTLVTLISLGLSAASCGNQEKKLDLKDSEVVELLNQVDKTNIAEDTIHLSFEMNMELEMKGEAASLGFISTNGSAKFDLYANISSYDKFFIYGTTKLDITIKQQGYQDTKIKGSFSIYMKKQNLYLKLDMTNAGTTVQGKYEIENTFSEEQYLYSKEQIDQALTVNIDQTMLNEYGEYTIAKLGNDYILRFNVTETIFKNILNNFFTIQLTLTNRKPLVIESITKFNEKIVNIKNTISFDGTFLDNQNNGFDAKININLSFDTNASNLKLPTDSELQDYFPVNANSSPFPFPIPSSPAPIK